MTCEQQTIYNALPKLPTYNFAELNEPATFGRKQYCTFDKDGGRSVQCVTNDGASNQRGISLVALCNRSVNQSSNPMSMACAESTSMDGCGIPVRVILDHFPTWRTLDDKVLRFFAYYTEDVSESTIETWRVRKVVINFYLSDGTVSISEQTPLHNTGLRNGLTVSRCKVENVNVFTLRVGETIACRGHLYTIVDCDAATRVFYDVLRHPQHEPLHYPIDAFEERQTRPNRVWNEEDAELRRVAEMQAALASHTHSSLLTPAERAHAMSFFAQDKNVLRFYAVWDKQLFRIFYYLADDTIAVMFDPVDNDGRERNAVFVRRSRVPRLPYTHCNVHLETLRAPHHRSRMQEHSKQQKDQSNAHTTSTTTTIIISSGNNKIKTNSTSGSDVEYIDVNDFSLGESVVIYDRPFYLYDCDLYTKEYLAAQGKVITSFPIPATEKDEIAEKRKEQGQCRQEKHNSGSTKSVNEANTTNLQTLTAVEKSVRFSHDAFRFEACLEKPLNASEAARRFMVCFYLSDNTIAIAELERANSGFAGGKTFSRRSVPELSDSSHFRVGNVVVLDGISYRLLAMDEHTRQCIRDGLPDVPVNHFALADLLHEVQEMLLKRFHRTSDAFLYFATLTTESDKEYEEEEQPPSERTANPLNKKQVTQWQGQPVLLSSIQGLTRTQVQRLFRECGKRLSEEELESVMAYVDSDHDGVVAIDDFSIHFMGDLFTSINRERQEWPSCDDAFNAGTMLSSASLSSSSMGPIESKETITKRITSTENAKRALHKLLLMTSARRRLIIRSLETKALSTYDNRIGIDDLKSVLQHRLQVEFSEAELDALVYRFFYSSGVVLWLQRRLEVSEFKRIIMM